MNRLISGIKNLCQYVLAACVLLAVILSVSAQEKVVRLASLEWLPYVGKELPQQGMSAWIAASALQKSGHQLKVEYFPWKRAMQLGGHDTNYAGYFPAYYTKERAQECHFSQPMGSSTLGLAYLKSAPLEWKHITDLALPAKQPIGVVFGYSNGAEFDGLVKFGRLKVDVANSDSQNLRKLLLGRLRAVVIDEAVLRYLLKTEVGLKPQASQIQFHPRALAALKLHVCFQRNAQGLEHKTVFDRALQEMDLAKLADEYFQKLESSNAKGLP